MEGPLRLPAESGGEEVTHSEKLKAILATVQTDPGNRGLARDPDDNLFTATAGDFERACRSMLDRHEVALEVFTGFFVPTASPPAFETDGPLGSVFLMRALTGIVVQIAIGSPEPCSKAMESGLSAAEFKGFVVVPISGGNFRPSSCIQSGTEWPGYEGTHLVAVEHAGRAIDGRSYSMRGRDITAETRTIDCDFLKAPRHGLVTIGIGDGGNEIGMGKIPHETIVKNIPNGDLIHCRVPTDHLIVAGVSNWGAYALAAGLFVLLDRKPPAGLFDPDRELSILEAMVRDGPLVDGVTGRQTATVDGLTWEEYSRPLVAIQRILDS